MKSNQLHRRSISLLLPKILSSAPSGAQNIYIWIGDRSGHEVIDTLMKVVEIMVLSRKSEKHIEIVSSCTVAYSKVQLRIVGMWSSSHERVGPTSLEWFFVQCGTMRIYTDLVEYTKLRINCEPRHD